MSLLAEMLLEFGVSSTQMRLFTEDNNRDFYNVVRILLFQYHKQRCNTEESKCELTSTIPLLGYVIRVWPWVSIKYNKLQYFTEYIKQFKFHKIVVEMLF